MVVIKNLRNEKPIFKYQVCVDRSSVLGNPFPMKTESRRDYVCDLYEKYFNEKLSIGDEELVMELNRLYNLHEKYGRLELFCWCIPKRCHAETIKKILDDTNAMVKLLKG